MTDFRINVIVDPAKAQAGTKTVERSLGRVEDRAAKVKRALGQAFALAGLGAGVIGATRLLADFSQEVSTVQAVSSATQDEIAALEQEFKDLGISTRFSASQAAEGATFLARAGFDATEVLESLDDTLRLAQAGALGLGEAADIASNVLTGFRLETDQAARVVDVLALAANSANTNVSQLGQALKFVAPVAAGVGVEVEETTAAIAALSNAGLQASLAGTGLRRILSELESPASKTRMLLRDLGVEANEVRVSQVGLTAALQRLADAGVDTGTALEIFGDRGGPAFEVLRTSIGDVEEMTAALQAADGTAARIAETMDSNLNGALLAVRSALEGFIIELGDADSGALEGSLRSLADALRFLARNIDDVVNALTLLGGGILAIKLAPLLTNLATATSRFVQLRAAVLSGRAVMLGSAEAARQQAAAELASAQATAADTAAALTNARARTAQAVVVRGSAEATFVHAAVTRQLTALEAQNVAATNAVTAAQVRLGTATAATTVKARLLNATFAVNPFVLLIAGAAAAVVALRKLDEILDEIEETQKIADAGAQAALSTYGKVGEEIQRVERQLEIFRDAVERNGDEFTAGARKVEELEGRLAKLRQQQENLANSTDKAREAAQKQREAIAAVNAAFDDQIAKLNQESVLLRKSNQEREVAAELLSRIASIEKEGSTINTSQFLLLNILTQRNQLLRDQAQVIDELNGPQEEFNRKLLAARTLFDEGRISAEQFLSVLRDLGFETFTPGGDVEADPEAASRRAAGLQELNAALAEEERLLKLTRAEREIDLELSRIEAELAEKKIVLDAAEKGALREKLEALQALNRVQEFLQENTDRFAQAEEDLRLLREQGILTVDQYTAALERLKAAQEGANEAAEGAPTQELTGFQQVLENLEGVASEALGGAKEAIQEFATTGQGSFDDFTQALLQDLNRILAEKALLALIDAFTGGAGGASSGILGAIFGGSRQEGGDVEPGKAFLVGEEGPELFTPPGAGNIVPAGETAAAMSPQQAPVVNVTTAPPVINVTNVTDPDEIPRTIDDGDADESIMNVLSRNRRRVKGITG